ncbi:hypothetical protein K7X08_033207 [Anisodus acutangulus]|uniref:Uncharacterized protein n=1 Tax=Anisodus acutangulus TaxID=402998 RepID=A0A9Q1M4S1_9SOLA|nr:hypothetical protein K7X08_033207 [Anisodus acutangulus]
MRSLWDKLHTTYVGPTCTCGALPKLLEEQQLFQFMSDLNESYSACKINILIMTPYPSLSKAYSMLQHDELKGKNSHTPIFSADSVAFSASTSASTSNSRLYNQRVLFEHRKPTQPPSQSSSYTFVCKYCKKPNHTIEKCNRLHDIPADFKFTKSKKVSVACVQSSEPSLSSVSISSSNPNDFNNFQPQQYRHSSSGYTPTPTSHGLVSLMDNINIISSF